MAKLLLVGWDAADWKVIDPLLRRGEMPNLARVLGGGVRGNLATIYPPLSPMVWTSIATGKRPTKHGIHGFTEPTEDGLAVRPISNLGRTTKAVWNILNQNGKRSIVVGWWPSHPAEPIDGVMVSNHFPLENHDQPDRPLLPGTVWPPDRAALLSDLRIHFTDVPGGLLRHFVPDWQKIDQAADKSLNDLGGIIAETASIHAAATELIAREEWDFAAVYYTGIDHFSHRFMRYHARKVRRRDGDTDPAIFRDVVVNAYRYHDAMLGRLIKLAGRDCAVMIVSDHGFHSDRLLPDHIPAEAAGPAVEHRDFGVFCLAGPGVRKGKRIYGASVLDVTPTVLHLFGLPAARDMDGKVLINAFTNQEAPETIPSWDNVQGEHGCHLPDRQYDGANSFESLQQLIALGYVAPPSDKDTNAVRAAIAENRYNLARSHMDAGRPDRGAELLRALIAEDPEQLRYHQHLFTCLLQQDDCEGCAEMLDFFDEACASLGQRARDELARRRAERPDKEVAASRAPGDRREIFERRELAEKASSFTVDRLLMRCRLALAQRADTAHKEAASALLDELSRKPAVRRQLRLFLGEGFAAVGQYERALDLTREARRADREDWRAMGLEARIHAAVGRHEEAADCAADSLSLVYFQPFLHLLLGTSLVQLGDCERAEQCLQVALAQAPGLAAAHDRLAALTRQQGRLGEASLHMALAEKLRQRVAARGSREQSAPEARALAMAAPVFERCPDAPPSNRSQIVTIVSGLPRSGTSMMMQMLAAAGLPAYTDGRRAPDVDNPRGYLEHIDATRLREDRTWLREARGRAVKIVAQLLPFLPEDEEYRLIFMHRDLHEVVASQHAMLARLDRRGGRIEAPALMRTYTAQLVRVRGWLEHRPSLPVLAVNYRQVLVEPGANAARLRRFLGAPFDIKAAAESVDASLRRQRQGDRAGRTEQVVL